MTHRYEDNLLYLMLRPPDLSNRCHIKFVSDADVNVRCPQGSCYIYKSVPSSHRTIKGIVLGRCQATLLGILRSDNRDNNENMRGFL